MQSITVCTGCKVWLEQNELERIKERIEMTVARERCFGGRDRKRN